MVGSPRSCSEAWIETSSVATSAQMPSGSPRSCSEAWIETSVKVMVRSAVGVRSPRSCSEAWIETHTFKSDVTDEPVRLAHVVRRGLKLEGCRQNSYE